MRPLLLLALWQVRNGVRGAVSDPKKLAPLLLLVAAVLGQFGAFAVFSGFQPPSPQMSPRGLMLTYSVAYTVLFFVLALVSLSVLDFALAEGFLAFNMADRDYLFPAPISPRAVLAYRLAARSLAGLAQGSVLFLFGVWKPLDWLAGGGAVYGGGLWGVAALFCCIGGYGNLALWVKLRFGFGRFGVLRNLLIAGIACVGVALFQVHAAAPRSGLRDLSLNPWVQGAFLPCYLAASAVIRLLNGAFPQSAMLSLATFYGGTLALVFVRNQPFYEASLEGTERLARMMQAAREGNMGTLFGISDTSDGQRSLERPLQMPGFGCGAGALLWAHLSSAAKRPVANLLAPAGAGCVVTLLIGNAVPARFAAWVVAVLVGYVVCVLTLSAQLTFRQALQRHGLVKPLPIADWQIVLVDLLPRTLLVGSLPFFAGASLLVSGFPDGQRVGLLLAVLPTILSVPFNAIQYLVAVWYPDAQDRVQQALSWLVGPLLMGGAAVVYLGVGLGASMLRLPILGIGAALAVTSLPLTVVTFTAAVWAYSRRQPQ